jgi:sugar fermentation stimulation protein A
VRPRALVPARLLARENRFRILAQVDGRRVVLACRDPGRMEQVLVPGAELRVSLEDVAGRRTQGTVWLARDAGTWVCVVPVLANRLFEAALYHDGLPGLAGAEHSGAEVTVGRSRFDFALRYRGREWLAEVKSVGVGRNGIALFPDAPTQRGARHLRELAEHARSGRASLVAFVVQRSDAREVRADGRIDPEFVAALAEARRAGVLIRAWGCSVSPRGLRIDRSLPVRAPLRPS